MTSAPAVCRADGIYTYVDENGRRVFTNVVPNAKGVSSGEPTGASTVTNRKKVKLPVPAGELESSKQLGDRIATLVEKYNFARYNLGPDFVRAVIKVESNFNPNALSRKGALGLMQLMPGTARRFGVRNVYNPEENLEGGIQYLNFLLDTFNGDVNLTLAAYNAGENIVQKLKAIPPYRETRDYVRRISDILGGSGSIPLYDYATKRVTYVALVGGRLKFTNVDPPAASVVFDGYHMPRAAGSL
ncbi:MAG: lytic transglycosylase domain-containing protein [Acidobacteriia bacterium]|nr:lytic transglycosylase domain-containing protein [Terriglobia bacterium]